MGHKRRNRISQIESHARTRTSLLLKDLRVRVWGLDRRMSLPWGHRDGYIPYCIVKKQEDNSS